jgi:hypothetical protein
MTYTYSILTVSKETYKEIENSLKQAGYDHVFHKQKDGSVAIDMSGIALVVSDPAEQTFKEVLR